MNLCYIRSSRLPFPDSRLPTAPIGNLFVALRRSVIRLWLTGFLLLTATPALAQVPSRTTLLQDERQAKEAAIVTPERALTERALDKIDDAIDFFGNITRGWKGFHFATGDFPSGAGFAYGLGYTNLAVGALYADADFPNRVDIDVVAAYSTSEYYQASFDLTIRNLGGAPFNIAFHGQAIEFPEEDFFGLGLASREENRTNYLMRSVDGGVDLWFELFKKLRVGGAAAYLSPSIGSGKDDLFVSTEDFFDETTLPGFQVQPDFWRYHGFVDFDYRDQPADPRVGGFYGVRFSNFRDRHLDTFHFRRYEVDLQQYLPLPNRYRVIALRANLVVTESSAGDSVPFYYMPTLGGGDRLRGFREFRFRDRNSLLLTAE